MEKCFHAPRARTATGARAELGARADQRRRLGGGVGDLREIRRRARAGQGTPNVRAPVLRRDSVSMITAARDSGPVLSESSGAAADDVHEVVPDGLATRLPRLVRRAGGRPLAAVGSVTVPGALMFTMLALASRAAPPRIPLAPVTTPNPTPPNVASSPARVEIALPASPSAWAPPSPSLGAPPSGTRASGCSRTDRRGPARPVPPPPPAASRTTAEGGGRPAAPPIPAFRAARLVRLCAIAARG